jgi:hypothetical protein
VRRAVLSLLAIALAIALLAGHGGVDPRSAAIAETGVAAAFALIAVVAWQRGTVPLPHPAALAAAGGLLLYSLLALTSEEWSLSPLASRQEALRTASYALAVLTGAALASFGGHPVRSVLALIGGLAVAECAWAIVERSFASTTFGLTGRLQGTLGNTNSLAMMGTVAAIAGLALARRSPAVGMAVASLGTFTAFATSSRAAAAMAVAAAGILALTTHGRPLRRLAPAAALLPAVGLGLWVSTLGVFDEVAGPVAGAGARLLLLALLAMTLGPVVLRLADAVASAVPSARRTIAERGLVGAGVAAAVVLVIAIAATNERGAPAITGLGHLFSSSSNFRTRWWRHALDQFQDDPWRGTGAGTFRIVETLARDPAHATVSPHNALVAALMGTGVVGGIAVLTAGIGLTVALVVGAVRSPERAPAVALALIGAALLVHGLVDVTWETPVLGVMLCLAAGVVPGATTRSLPVMLRYGVAAVGAAVAVLLATGAIRSGAGVVTAGDAFLQPTPVQSLATAEDALQLEPRSANAHIAAADARAKLGDPGGAIVDLVAALRLEPDNYTAWLNAARLQQTVFGDRRGAVATLTRAYDASGRRRQVRIELNQAEREAGLPLTR